tara:strand:- start:548 stop:1873 length:1326 start_codon:yes stop_codon:yes gene_type:complete
MFLPRIIIKSGFLVCFCLAQGPLNSFGIGNHQKWLSPSQGGIGSIGLVPTFKNEVSLSNPASWPNLKFTHLSISYNGFESVLNSNSNNSFSNLQSAQLIVPIKQKHSFGISLHPYSYQQVNLSDTSLSDIYVYDDTISIDKKYEQAGGIMALDLSLSSSLFSGNNIGFTIQLLFGSSRQNKSLILEQRSYSQPIPFIQNSRLNYSGINLSLYLIQKSNLMNFYLKSSFSLNPLEALYTELYPFDDTNNNGYHDFTYNYASPGYDFPHPDDIPKSIESRITNIYDKSALGIGLTREILKRMYLSAEFDRNKDKSSFDNRLPNSFNFRIKSNDNFSFGLVWFPDDLSFRFIDNFTFRTGIVYNKYSYDEYDIESKNRIDNNSITQFGYSVGFGYKFKAVGNQIDFSYYSGARDFPHSYNTEKLREFQIGISIADIWFIKRRQR